MVYFGRIGSSWGIIAKVGSSWGENVITHKYNMKTQCKTYNIQSATTT